MRNKQGQGKRRYHCAARAKCKPNGLGTWHHTHTHAYGEGFNTCVRAPCISWGFTDEGWGTEPSNGDTGRLSLHVTTQMHILKTSIRLLYALSQLGLAGFVICATPCTCAVLSIVSAVSGTRHDIKQHNSKRERRCSFNLSALLDWEVLLYSSHQQLCDIRHAASSASKRTKVQLDCAFSRHEEQRDHPLSPQALFCTFFWQQSFSISAVLAAATLKFAHGMTHFRLEAFVV